MVIITTETQKKIIEAFLILSSTYSGKKITVEMIGREIGMSREIYTTTIFEVLKKSLREFTT